MWSLFTTEEEDNINLSDFDLSHIINGDFKSALNKLILKYSDVFSKTMRTMGRTHLSEHIIEVETSTPVKSRAYKVSHKERNIIDEQIQEMLEHDVSSVSEEKRWKS